MGKGIEMVQSVSDNIISSTSPQGFNNINLNRKINSADHFYHLHFDPIYLQENNNDVYVYILVKYHFVKSISVFVRVIRVPDKKLCLYSVVLGICSDAQVEIYIY